MRSGDGSGQSGAFQLAGYVPRQVQGWSLVTVRIRTKSRCGISSRSASCALAREEAELYKWKEVCCGIRNRTEGLALRNN